MHGLTRSLLNNMVVGVTEGYHKESGGQRRRLPRRQGGNKLIMNLAIPIPWSSRDPRHRHRGTRSQQDRHFRLR
jgi:hypothetical protein